MIRPATTDTTLLFGSTDEPYNPNNPHKGVDFSHSPDNKIYMPEDGVVNFKLNNGTCGNSIYIAADNRRHTLCHISKYLVPPGSPQKQGTAIAVMGNTGLAKGVHLHWVVRVNNQLVDPLTLVKENNMYPNTGDLTNFYNRTGWPGHAPNPNDIAYWTAGTGNDGWAAGADNVWKDLGYSVTLYVLEHSPSDAQQKLEQIKQIVG